jgi:lipoprotein-releasing system permease protein
LSLPPSLYIGLRFTTSRKRSLIFSLLGVIFGVAFFVCTQAQTQGFEQYFIKTILGTSGAIVISDRFQNRYTSFSNSSGGTVLSGQQRRKYYEGITNAAEIMRVTRQFSNVIACAPIVQGNVTVRGDFQTEVCTLQGIELEMHLRATALRDQLIGGKVEDFRVNPNGMILGSLLADKMQLKVGDNLTLIGADGVQKAMTLVAIFRSGNNIIDERRGYVALRVAQNLLKKSSLVSQIIVTLRNPDRAPALADHFERLFGHRARSWQEREQGNLQIFTTLRLSAAITVSLIILLAGALIFNTLTMTVLDKVREIAILRSMGYRRFDISAIFLFQGVIIAFLGSLLGAMAGAGMTYLISLIPIKVRGILYTDRFIVAWSGEHYLYASLIAFFAVLMASYFPARRAANLAPVTTLRGSGQ